MSDTDLLQRYIEARSEAAFETLLERHLALVYSVARRLVRSPQAAEDVTQAVFCELAQQAHRIGRHTPVVAWLHVVARRTAIDVIRHESRRRVRETAAAEESRVETPRVPMDPDQPTWTELEPLLDEAVASLKSVDRAAVLLRFFQNKTLREIGDELGISDDAAQKRVARALDQLRRHLARRSVSLSAATLAATVTAHALEAAPATLGSSVAASVSAQSAAAVALSSSTPLLAMTATQKIVAATALALAVGTGLFEAVVISRQRAELAEHRTRLAALTGELERLRAVRDQQSHQLGAAEHELAQVRAAAAKLAAADPAMEAALDEWLQKVVRLREYLDATPTSQIPELRYLTAKDWLDATKEGSLETELDLRRALSDLRRAAKQRFSPELMTALQRYLKANQARPPSDVAQLAPFFERSVDPAILARYGVFSIDESDPSYVRMIGPDGPARWMIREKDNVDDYYDSTVFVSSAGHGVQGSSKYDRELNAAYRAYAAAHNGNAPSTAADVAPYLPSTIDPVFIQRRLENKP